MTVVTVEVTYFVLFWVVISLHAEASWPVTVTQQRGSRESSRCSIPLVYLPLYHLWEENLKLNWGLQFKHLCNHANNIFII